MLQTVLSKKVLKILEQILLEGKILLRVYFRDIKDGIFWSTEAALQTCSREKVFWKYAENLQENTHAEVWFQWSCFATLLKSDFGKGVFL